ncbi:MULTISPECIES: putative 2OG-Fe(II) oxygenase [unclassified Pseudoxanthomonas]|uniref:putative 2OG-Fe(II) oxygenase n=1 Tax=unclassified Pseudoxanthomonas TaxID=2645906 RepID=UPI00307814B3
MTTNEIQATVHPLYAVPMLQCSIADANRLNSELTELFLDLEREGDRHRDPIKRDTQYGIFESNFFLHQRSEAPIRKLFEFVRASLHTFIQGINQFTDQEMSNIVLDMHSWFHVTRKGGFQSLHNHPNASWSAIYCVDPGDASQPESGAVRFHDPRTGCDMYRDPSIERMQPPYRMGPWQLNHIPGQMLVFPSYLLHEIFPYTGERPRVVVALNSWCRWKQPPAS